MEYNFAVESEEIEVDFCLGHHHKPKPETGTTDHTQLKNRDVENQHPIDAITGLRNYLDEIDIAIDDLQHNQAALDIPTKISELENDSNFVTELEINNQLELKADKNNTYTKEEVDEKIKYYEHEEVDLTDYLKKKEAEELYATKDNLELKADKSELDNYCKLSEVDNKLNDALENSVKYSDYEDRKTLQLNNHDSISGLSTNGTGYNLAMVSKWNVADFGSQGIHLNLNTKDNITINDKEVVALESNVNKALELKANKSDLNNAVNYKDFTYNNEQRKTIQLNNHDSISGIGANCLEGTPNGYKGGEDFSGQGFNLAMLSKWNVADFGSSKVHLNLNTKDNITINDNDVIAVESVVDTKINNAIQNIDLSSYSTKEEVNNQLELKADKTDLDNIKIDAYTKEESDKKYQAKGNYLTEHQSLENYVTKSNLEDSIKDSVNYRDFTYNGEENRKTIELENYNNISGKDTTGIGHNLAMISKWNVADFGAVGLHANINTKDNLTINDNKIVVTEDDLVDVVKTKNFTYTNADNETLTRKTIELANYDSISGKDTKGNGHNLVMLSKWDVADFGASGVHLNLNTKDNITINDNDVIATESNVNKALELKADKNNTYTKEEVDAKLSSIYRFQGSVDNYDKLPTLGVVVGDVYNVNDTGANYAWNGILWDKLSETVDLTNYVTKDMLQLLINRIETLEAKISVLESK